MIFVHIIKSLIYIGIENKTNSVYIRHSYDMAFGKRFRNGITSEQHLNSQNHIRQI